MTLEYEIEIGVGTHSFKLNKVFLCKNLRSKFLGVRFLFVLSIVKADPETITHPSTNLFTYRLVNYFITELSVRG